MTTPSDNVTRGARDNMRKVAPKLSRSEMTDEKKLQLVFWTSFVSYCDENPTSFFNRNRPRPQPYMSFYCLGRGGFHVDAAASLHEIEATLYVDGVNAKAHYQALEYRLKEIEGS